MNMRFFWSIRGRFAGGANVPGTSARKTTTSADRRARNTLTLPLIEPVFSPAKTGTAIKTENIRQYRLLNISKSFFLDSECMIERKPAPDCFLELSPAPVVTHYCFFLLLSMQGLTASGRKNNYGAGGAPLERSHYPPEKQRFKEKFVYLATMA